MTIKSTRLRTARIRLSGLISVSQSRVGNLVLLRSNCENLSVFRSGLVANVLFGLIWVFFFNLDIMWRIKLHFFYRCVPRRVFDSDVLCCAGRRSERWNVGSFRGTESPQTSSFCCHWATGRSAWYQPNQYRKDTTGLCSVHTLNNLDRILYFVLMWCEVPAVGTEGFVGQNFCLVTIISVIKYFVS